jgi:hypothetical protein
MVKNRMINAIKTLICISLSVGVGFVIAASPIGNHPIVVKAARIVADRGF